MAQRPGLVVFIPEEYAQGADCWEPPGTLVRGDKGSQVLTMGLLGESYLSWKMKLEANQASPLTAEACEARPVADDIASEGIQDCRPHFLTPRPVLHVTARTSVEKLSWGILTKENHQAAPISEFCNVDLISYARMHPIKQSMPVLGKSPSTGGCNI